MIPKVTSFVFASMFLQPPEVRDVAWVSVVYGIQVVPLALKK